MIQDLINDVKSYYNNVEAWKTFNNEVWIESKNELLIIKDNAIVSSTNDKIINYRFGLRFLVQSQKHCHKFISIGKTRMRYILSENNVTMKNFSSNINFWGVYNFDEYGKIFRFLNKLYRQMKLIRKIPDEQSIDNRCLKIVKIDVISLTFEIEDGVVYFKFIYASTAKIKRSWCGFDFIKFVMTNDLKKLIYQEEKNYEEFSNEFLNFLIQLQNNIQKFIKKSTRDIFMSIIFISNLQQQIL
ncbi:hypothetical protein pb186bvf_012848 [Paramecium bursaria]